MTQDEIIRMARKAGWQTIEDQPIGLLFRLEQFTKIIIDKITPVIIAEKEASIQVEREACAKLVETIHAKGLQSIREACAAAIRARGNV